jgi:hypothetical protein
MGTCVGVPMQVLAAAAVGVLVVVSIAVGLRLLALHRRGGGAPELLLGGMLLLSVGLGYPLLIAADRAGPDAVRPLFVVSTLAVNAGFALLFAFTWRVFRPGAPWARGLAGAGVLCLLVNAGLRVWDGLTQQQIRIAAEVVGESVLQTTPVMAAYLWTAWESLRYHALMRRRVRLGLADAAVSDRFLLWGLTALAVTAGVLLNTVALALQVSIFESPWVLLGSSATGLAQAVLLVLAFAPPRAYLAWVRARARTREAGAAAARPGATPAR